MGQRLAVNSFTVTAHYHDAFDFHWSQGLRTSSARLVEHLNCSQLEFRGRDGTRTRGLLRDRRRSNQLNYAPAFKIDSLRFPRIRPTARRFLKLPENTVTGQWSAKVVFVICVYAYSARLLLLARF